MSRARTNATLLVLALGTMSLATHGRAQSPIECAPTTSIDPTRFLRQTTLDLLGRPPTEAEYLAVRAAGAVTPATVDALLESDEHLSALGNYHRSLLNDTIAQLPALTSARNVLSHVAMTATSSDVWFGRTPATFRRGANSLSCADVPHDRFMADGTPIPLATAWAMGDPVTNAAGMHTTTILSGTGASCTRAAPCRMDGWVEVEPFWAPGTMVRVCAFDAQSAATGTDANGHTVQCDPRNYVNPSGGPSAAACGCGPNLRWCAPSAAAAESHPMHDAIEEEPLRIFDDVLRNHRDYFEALTTRRTFVNGPLAAYLRTSGGGVVYDIDEPIMDMPYDADWTPVMRGSTHSGVLTTMAYLERFTSERGRAHRFIQAFLCSDFSSISLPPAQPQPPIDLAQREGCNGCHASLEPLTQYWGHFRINLDFGTLDDGSGTFATLGTSTMNPRAPTCATCARTGGTCPEYCNLYYWTYDNSPSWDQTHVGELQVAAFDWSSPGLDDDRARFDGGPAALVATNLARTDPHAPSPMESCAVEQRAESLLHRRLTADERAHWLPALADAFQASGVHDFRDLERAIVNDPRYRGLGMSQ